MPRSSFAKLQYAAIAAAVIISMSGAGLAAAENPKYQAMMVRAEAALARGNRVVTVARVIADAQGRIFVRNGLGQVRRAALRLSIRVPDSPC
ncbi:MAG: hypothetical protein HYX63_02845 [Gammaproteobacteria bacterium]|nr:hypothetical protein [Gammaproteobacteria bacterium]